VFQANQRVEEYKRQIKSLTVKLKEVSPLLGEVEANRTLGILLTLVESLILNPFLEVDAPRTTRTNLYSWGHAVA
jgi:hypothetical protein